MDIFNEINRMKKEGLDDSQISRRLREQGLSPREIDDALDQDQIKSGAYGEVPDVEAAAPYPTFQPEIASHAQPEEFEQPAIALGNYPENRPEQGYGEYPEYQYQNEPLDTEMINEIVEQILEEKTKEMQRDLSELVKFRIEMQGIVEQIDYRLKRIEKTIDKLQTSVIGSIGNYGKNISDLKKEMQTTQDSFSKVVNPLAENLEELRKITKGIDKKTAKDSKKKTKKT